MLLVIPSGEQLKDLVVSIFIDYVAGLDGFSSLFFSHRWDIIQEDLSWIIFKANTRFKLKSMISNNSMSDLTHNISHDFFNLIYPRFQIKFEFPGTFVR